MGTRMTPWRTAWAILAACILTFAAVGIFLTGLALSAPGFIALLPLFTLWVAAPQGDAWDEGLQLLLKEGTP
jgi:hypothetical protein